MRRWRGVVASREASTPSTRWRGGGRSAHVARKQRTPRPRPLFINKSPVPFQPRQPQRPVLAETRPEEGRVLVRVAKQHGYQRVGVGLFYLLFFVLVKINILARAARFQRL